MTVIARMNQTGGQKKDPVTPFSCAEAGELLANEKSQIIERWETRCRQEVPAAKCVNRLSLINSLPGFLEQMAKTLRSPESAAEADSNAEVACAHGEERARLGNYTLDEVICEYQVLREVVVRHLEVTRPLATTTQEVLHAFIDRGIRKAAARYSQLSRSELSLINEELQNRNVELIQLNNDINNLINSVSIPVLIIGLDRRIRRFTPAASKVMHLAPSDVGRGIGDIRIHFDIPDLLVQVTKVMEGARVEEREVRNGEGRWFSMAIRPYETGEKKVEGAVVTLFDIDSIHRALDDLVRINIELEQFAYVASHDLREPLRMVSTFLDLLSRRHGDKLNKEAQEFIDIAMKNARRMRALVEDLLAFSQTGRAQLKYEPTDCSLLVDKTIASLKPYLEEARAEISRGPLPTINSSEMLIGQVFQNLVANAVKFRTDHSPKIHISARENNLEWEFSVRDNGIGIEKSYLERIFLIFQRLHDPQQYPGTGIGLAICKRIVERYGGRIWVESQPDDGSTFFFTIPKIVTVERALLQ